MAERRNCSNSEMNPDKLPRCECEFDQNTGKVTKITFINCPDDQDARVCVVEDTIAQVDKQLAARSGLTNRNRRALAKNRNALQRLLNSWQPQAVVENANDSQKSKAIGKKLQSLARKFDRSQKSE
jgi:hypothetical protein